MRKRGTGSFWMSRTPDVGDRNRNHHHYRGAGGGSYQEPVLAVGASGLFGSVSPHWLQRRLEASRKRGGGNNGRGNDDELNKHFGQTPPYVYDSRRIGRDPRKFKRRDHSAGGASRTSESPSSGDVVFAPDRAAVLKGIVYGLVNSIVTVPTMVGFTSIIYRDPFFTEDAHNYFGKVLKLVLLSSSIHQVCFTILSTLPFAVGQVQDAGLIFLSSMAVSIVAKLSEEDVEPDKIMATVAVTLSLCTAVLGLCLMLTGKLKLAGLVQYLPLPVIGGYLAFIGLFCGESGLRLTTGRKDIVGIGGLLHLFSLDTMRLAAPGLLSALVMLIISYRVQNQLVLPLFLVSLPVGFFAIMLASGASMEDARHHGWLANTTETPAFWEVFNVFQFKSVHWNAAFPSVIPTFIAMYLVVAFGSCLDVAAISYELGRPLDYDHELKMVGFSNAVSGVTGGYTGSYIFSQSIFTLRNGITSRSAGWIVALVEFLLFLLPVDLPSILPRFFFGSVLLFVSIDLLLEWLVYAYFRVDMNEYVIIWLSFIFINMWGLEAGMAAGVVVTALNFVIAYSKNSTVEAIENPSSNVVRALVERQALESQRDRIVALRLSGFQFFGSTIQVIQAVKQNVVVRSEPASSPATPASVASASGSTSTFPYQPDISHHSIASAPGHGAAQSTVATGLSSDMSRLREPLLPVSVSVHRNRIPSEESLASNESTVSASGNSGTRATFRMKRSMTSDNLLRNLSSREPYPPGAGTGVGTTVSGLGPFKRSRPKLSTLLDGKPMKNVETRFVVLDCKGVPSIDATAARGCFLTLLFVLREWDIHLIFSGLSPRCKSLLESHGVLARNNDQAEDFAVQDSGTDRINDGHAQNDSGSSSDLEDPFEIEPALSFDNLNNALEWCEDRILDAMITNPRRKEHGALYHVFPENWVLKIAKYSERMEFGPDDFVFTRNSPADHIYVVEKGNVALLHDLNLTKGTSSSVFGHDDFFREGNPTYTYSAMTTSSHRVHVLYRFSKASYMQMLEKESRVAVEFQAALIRALLLK